MRRKRRRSNRSGASGQRDRIATGNILPASVPLVCVDINPATVVKLADRGSSQARGIVTDVGLFLEQLARDLVPNYSARH